MYVEIFKGDDGQWYLRLKAANGEPLTVSEGYTRRWSAKRAARRVFPQLETRVV